MNKIILRGFSMFFLPMVMRAILFFTDPKHFLTRWLISILPNVGTFLFQLSIFFKPQYFQLRQIPFGISLKAFFLN